MNSGRMACLVDIFLAYVHICRPGTAHAGAGEAAAEDVGDDLIRPSGLARRISMSLPSIRRTPGAGYSLSFPRWRIA